MANIYYYDIGDYLDRDEKLQIIAEADGLQGIDWQTITPNEKHDWINQRGDVFDTFIAIGAKRENTSLSARTIFDDYSSGLKTGRDAWCYNFSLKKLTANMERFIVFYNEQVEAYKKRKEWDIELQIDDFIEYDLTKISWDSEIKKDVERYILHSFEKTGRYVGLYRPFCKQHVYFNRRLNQRTYQMPKIFPKPGVENLMISVCGVGGSKSLTPLIHNTIIDLNFQEAGAQCFPYWVYDTSLSASQNEMFPRTRRENISDAMLEKFRVRYALSELTKEDIFYYVYGILHSSDYKTRFASDLKKQLPRIPLVDDFWTFSQAGRKLAGLHLNYETGEMYPLKEQTADGRQQETGVSYHVTKMRFPSKTDKSTIIYNEQLRLAHIPPETYKYIVNGKSALEWVMDRYQITTHKESGIVNDPNDWCKEQGNERYIVDLIKRVVHLSVESVKIIDGLPAVQF